MSDDKNLIKIRDTFRESADIIDELLTLDKREKNGENVEKELESAAGRLMFKMIEINELNNK